MQLILGQNWHLLNLNVNFHTALSPCDLSRELLILLIINLIKKEKNMFVFSICFKCKDFIKINTV